MFVSISAVQAQSRAQRYIVIVNANFYFEIRDFLLCTGPSRLSGVRDLLNDTFKFAVAVRVNFDVCLIPKFHVYDIILVHVHHGLG